MPDSLSSVLPPALRYAGAALALAGCLGLTGCAVKVHSGHTSSVHGHGHGVKAHGGAVKAPGRFAHGHAARPPGRVGGSHAHVHLGTGAAVVILVGLMIADAVHYVSNWISGPPPAERSDEALQAPCACPRPAVEGGAVAP